MSLDFPPPAVTQPQDREQVQSLIQVSRSFEDGVAGIHLLIEGHAYFVKRADARRMARQILFNEN